jgi:hypothetical protein
MSLFPATNKLNDVIGEVSSHADLLVFSHGVIIGQALVFAVYVVAYTFWGAAYSREPQARLVL